MRHVSNIILMNSVTALSDLIVTGVAAEFLRAVRHTYKMCVFASFKRLV